VIVEVLSDSTEAYDRGRKFGYYRACPSVQEYLIVATTYQTVEIYHRTAEIWTYDAYGSGDVIEVMSLDLHILVDALYRNAGVAEGTEEPEGKV
jgi:Uma2 family endonuclease